MTHSVNLARHLAARAVFAAVFFFSLVGAGPALASPAQPASSAYNSAPYCTPTSGQMYVGTYCGPWNVPVDPSNPFADSYGQCVYWTVEKRPDIWNDRSPNDPNPDDWDAWTWVGHAEAEGLSVTGQPRPGDVAVWSRAMVGNDTGHVAYVEAVNGNGSITITEMNHYFPGEGDREVLAPTSGPNGWQGLQFIHLPGAALAAAKPNDGSATRGRPRSRPQRGVRSELRISALSRAGRLTVSVRVSSGRGVPLAVAEAGSRRVGLHRIRVSAHLFVFRADLGRGNWTLVVWCTPVGRDRTPRPVSMRLRIA